MNPNLTLDQIEKEVILHRFSFHQFNKTKTAMSLGIAIRTLDNKLEQYGAIIKAEDTGDDTKPRVHVEPTQRVPEKQSVPVQKRIEVQKVSSK